MKYVFFGLLFAAAACSKVKEEPTPEISFISEGDCQRILVDNLQTETKTAKVMASIYSMCQDSHWREYLTEVTR